MVTQKQLRKLNDVFAALKEEKKDLLEKLQQKGIFADQAAERVYVRTLYDDGVDTLTDLFMGDSFKQYGGNVIFERLPVTQSMYSDVPLLIISDESEVDQESSRKLCDRQNSDAPTFPVIIFPDDYFKTRKGENLAYIPICESLKAAAACSIMPFRKRDINEQPAVVKLFVGYICEAVVLWRIKRELRSLLAKLEEECAQVYQMTGGPDAECTSGRLIEKMAACNYLGILAERCEFIRKKLEKIDRLSVRYSGFENTLHDEYDKHILGIVTHVNEEDASDFSIRLKLTYGILNNNLEDLCRQAERELNRDKLSYPLEQVVDATRRAIGSSAADIAFIGTFSSGKTTLINTLLGHRHKLRTSGKHNTAVLMELAATDTEEEYYEIKYKKELKWDMIYPSTFTTKSFVNEFDCNAKVISVRKSADGSSVIRYRSVKTGEIREANVGSGHVLAVREGALMRPRASLVAVDMDRNVFRLCSLAELAYIEELLSSPKVSEVCLIHSEGETKGVNGVRKFIADIKPLYEGTQNEYATPSRKREDLKAILGNRADRYRIATFSCKLTKFCDRKRRLDEKGWQDFVGEGPGNLTPFSESPECYMLSQKVKLYLKCEFLKYCSITDTPGFGSITDEHDAITERYLRDSRGKLVVMITVNLHTFDQKFDDMIRSIALVFRNYRPSQMKDVSFVLNCFTNTLPMEQCRNSVEKVIKYIRDFGFKENDIYVDNLKEVLEANSDKKEYIHPYPAYASFKENCLSRFLTDAVCRKYEEVQDQWDAFFSQNISWLETQISQYRRDMRDRKKREEELKNTLCQIQGVEFPPVKPTQEKIQEEFDGFYERFKEEFGGNRKGIFTSHRRNAVKSVMEEEFQPILACWEDEEAEFAGRLKVPMDRLYFHARISDVPEVASPRGRLVVATLEKIRSLLLEADDETHWYNKKKQTNYYMERLKNLLNQDARQSISNVQKYYDGCLAQFTERKNFIIGQVKKELTNLKDEGSLEKSIQDYEVFRNVLTAFKKQTYDVISFKL